MLRKILLACCVVGFSIGILGCPGPDASKKQDKPAATDKKVDDKAGKRPVAPPHAPGNS
jgi:hypothetical protein